MKEKLGEILLEQGMLTEAQLEVALAEQQRTGGKLDHIRGLVGYAHLGVSNGLILVTGPTGPGKTRPFTRCSSRSAPPSDRSARGSRAGTAPRPRASRGGVEPGDPMGLAPGLRARPLPI